MMFAAINKLFRISAKLTSIVNKIRVKFHFTSDWKCQPVPARRVNCDCLQKWNIFEKLSPELFFKCQKYFSLHFPFPLDNTMLQSIRMWVCGVIGSDGTEIPEIFCVKHQCWVGSVFSSGARNGEAGSDERPIILSLSRSASDLTCSGHVSSEDSGGKRDLTRTKDLSEYLAFKRIEIMAESLRGKQLKCLLLLKGIDNVIISLSTQLWYSRREKNPVNFGIFLEYQSIGTISTYFTTGSLWGEKEATDPDKGHPNWFPGSSIFFVAKTFIKITDVWMSQF